MNDLPDIYAEGPCEAKQVSSPSIIADLRRTKLSLEERLNNINNAIAAMEAHPEVAKVMELVSKAKR